MDSRDFFRGIVKACFLEQNDEFEENRRNMESTENIVEYDKTIMDHSKGNRINSKME